MSLFTKPRKFNPRSSSGQSGGKDSNGILFHMFLNEGICAKLRVLTSSRHSGPAFIAIKPNNVAEKTVPIRAAVVSAVGFDSRFNDMVLRLPLNRMVLIKNACEWFGHGSPFSPENPAFILNYRTFKDSKIQAFSMPDSKVAMGKMSVRAAHDAAEF